MALIGYITGQAAWASSLRFRDYRILWASTFLFAVGWGMENVALGWLVLDLTDSPFMVGLSMAARLVPFLFLGLPSGAIADRVDRRVFLSLFTAGGGIPTALLAVLLLADAAHVFQVMFITVAIGCFFAFNMTFRQAYTYDIVGQRLALNGLSLGMVAHHIGGVFGALSAGAIIPTLGVGNQYLAIAASYLVGGAVLMATGAPAHVSPRSRQPVLASLAETFRIIRGNRILLILMVLTGVTEMFGFSHLTLLPVFARDVLGVGAGGLAFMIAAWRTGGMLGLLALAALGDYRHKGKLMFGTVIAFGLGQMLLSVPLNIYLFLAFLAIINGSGMAADTLYKTLMQENVPDEQRGRAMGSWVFSLGASPVGHMGIGGVAGVLGAPAALLVNGGMLALVNVAFALGFPRIRNLE